MAAARGCVSAENHRLSPSALVPRNLVGDGGLSWEAITVGIKAAGRTNGQSAKHGCGILTGREHSRKQASPLDENG